MVRWLAGLVSGWEGRAQAAKSRDPELASAGRTRTGDGSVDCWGQAADKATTGRWRSAVLIFAMEFCERLGALGISLNLITYLVENMNIELSRAANIVTNFVGTLYITSLVGGFLADSCVGRFWTIAVSSSIQFLGMALLSLSASLPALRPESCGTAPTCRPTHGHRLVVLYVALYVIALGSGGIKPNVSAFGADQFDRTDERESRQLGPFFNVFFFFLSVAAVISVTVLVWVQDNVGRGWGFGVSAGIMLVALIFFILGRSVYRYKNPNGSPFTHIARVLVAAIRNRNLGKRSSRVFELDDASRLTSGKEKVGHTNQFGFLDRAALVDPHRDESALAAKHASWRLTTRTEVEEVKQVLRILPVWVFTVLFYTAYAQLTTFTVQQSVTMNRRFGPADSHNFQIPSASVSVFLEIGIIALLLLYQPAIVPIARYLTEQDTGLTSLQRIGAGLFFGIIGMIVAAAVELKRIHKVRSYGVTDNPTGKVPLSVFWLLPQFVIIGIGEGLLYVGQLEFFYKESPDGMRSFGTALFITSISLGFFTSTGFVTQVNKYSKGDSHPNGWLGSLNHAQLYKFYWLLAIVSAINFVFFLCAAKWYRYKKVDTRFQDQNNLPSTNTTQPHDPSLLPPPPLQHG